MAKDPNQREREFDVITFLLAGVLSVIVLGAVGYGILKSSRVATVVPPPPIGLHMPVSADRLPSAPSTTGSR
jgi:hypothetical protein